MNKSILGSVLIIALGVAWLLNVLGIVPRVDWIWTIALAAVGLLVLLGNGLNRQSFVIGLFLLAASVLSVMRQTSRIRPDVEVPVLIIVLGLLCLLAQVLRLPKPRWMEIA